MVTKIKSKADFGLMTFMESGFFVQCGKGKELREIGRLRSCEMFFRRGGVLIDQCVNGLMCPWVDLLIRLGAFDAAEC